MFGRLVLKVRLGLLRIAAASPGMHTHISGVGMATLMGRLPLGGAPGRCGGLGHRGVGRPSIFLPIVPYVVVLPWPSLQAMSPEERCSTRVFLLSACHPGQFYVSSMVGFVGYRLRHGELSHRWRRRVGSVVSFLPGSWGIACLVRAPGEGGIDVCGSRSVHVCVRESLGLLGEVMTVGLGRCRFELGTPSLAFGRVGLLPIATPSVAGRNQRPNMLRPISSCQRAISSIVLARALVIGSDAGRTWYQVPGMGAAAWPMRGASLCESSHLSCAPAR